MNFTRRRLPATIVSLIFIFATVSEGQSRIGQWHTYSSQLSTTAVAYKPGLMIAATRGGLLFYDTQTGELETYDLNDGLLDADIKAMTLSGDWLWLGGGSPNGLIQLLNLETGRLDAFDLGIGRVTHIVADADRGIVAYLNGQDVGLVEIRWNGSAFEYFDIYRNFPGIPTQIRDLDLTGDSLFVTTNVGVIGNDLIFANLKDPATWRIGFVPDSLNVLQYHADSTGHYTLTANNFSTLTDSGWISLQKLNVTDVRTLRRASNGEYVIALSNATLRLSRGGQVHSSTRYPRIVLDGVGAPELGGVYAVVSNRGLAFHHYSSGETTEIIPNSSAGIAYSAIIKRSNGDVVAVGDHGITRFNGQSWYNIIPGLSLNPRITADRIGDAAMVVSSSAFLADTLVFGGKTSWNIVELSNGDLMFGFRGNRSENVGVMRIDIDHVGDYTTFDTTDGNLDGLTDGFLTIRHLAKDSLDNVWISHPFGQIYGNAFSVYHADESWSHFAIGEGGHVQGAPTEIAFDDQQRVWIANEVNSVAGSTGGLTVLDYGTSIGEKSDDEWTSISTKFESSASNTIWSLTFDHAGQLWIITPNGVMGYNILPGPTLQKALGFGPVLSDVPFGEGSKIRVDADNNKWITTPSDGMWILLENTTFWPSVDGLNVENSGLPSNEVLDLYLDDDTGVAYITTRKGIATLRIPFRTKVESYAEMKIFPSPFRIPTSVPMVIDGLRQGSTVKIFTVSGRLVRELTSLGLDVQGDQATWDGRNKAGEMVGSGVYLVAAYLASGETGVGKVAVIRR